MSMPGSQVWAVLFFVMLFCLGMSSQFGQIEGVLVSTQELKIYPKSWSKEAGNGEFNAPFLWQSNTRHSK